jgi:hypothetical protein
MKANPTSAVRYSLAVETPSGPDGSDYFQVDLAVCGRRREQRLRLVMASVSLAALISLPFVIP